MTDSDEQSIPSRVSTANPTHHKCWKCGYVWRHGRSGEHICSDFLKAKADRMQAALERIERWFGEFPETGKFWDDDARRPMSYGACYGFNGERDFMRQIAREALQ